LIIFVFNILALIIEFRPESNITSAIDNGILSHVLTSVLESSKETFMPDKMKIKVDINGKSKFNTNIHTPILRMLCVNYFCSFFV
jgi:hypothetical protein